MWFAFIWSVGSVQKLLKKHSKVWSSETFICWGQLFCIFSVCEVLDKVDALVLQLCWELSHLKSTVQRNRFPVQDKKGWGSCDCCLLANIVSMKKVRGGVLRRISFRTDYLHTSHNPVNFTSVRGELTLSSMCVCVVFTWRWDQKVIPYFMGTF